MNSLRHQNYKNENAEKKNSWYDWLINYISEIGKKLVGSFKEKIGSLLKTNATDNYSKPIRAKNVYKEKK